jgi:hypothetical protein
MESVRRSALDQNQSPGGLESAKNVMESDAQEVVKMTPSKVEAEDDPAALEIASVKEESPQTQNYDLKSYTPDPYSKEIIEKMAKQIKYEVNIVQLFKDGQVSEEIFTRLFNSMADEISSLMTRRGEVVNELNGLMKGYKSTVLSA